MPSLIEELQRDALSPTVSVTELLQKCIVVGMKLNIEELSKWAKLELDGYLDTKVPRYRDVRGTPQVFNPYHGYQPLVFNDSRQEEMISLMPFNQPISEIEHHLQSYTKSNKTSFHVSYPAEVATFLRMRIDHGLQPSLQVSTSQLAKILEGVRRAILEWALRLEQAGVRGEGTSFSNDEKIKAQSFTFVIQGNVSNSQIATIGSTQSNVSEIDVHIRKLIATLRESQEALQLQHDRQAELNAEIQSMETQMDSPNPRSSILNECLVSIREILENAMGTVAATMILQKFPSFFGM